MEDIQEVTQQCMNSGANITEIKTIRKRLSDVKGGRNQEIALSAAHGIRDLQNVVIFHQFGWYGRSHGRGGRNCRWEDSG